MASTTEQKQELMQEIIELGSLATMRLSRTKLRSMLIEAMTFVAGESTLTELKAWKVQLREDLDL